LPKLNHSPTDSLVLLYILKNNIYYNILNLGGPLF
jgi:hypothetical protein